MNQQLIKGAYKQLYRFANRLDTHPALKFIMSDLFNETISTKLGSSPKWLTPDIRTFGTSLLGKKLAYLPEKSAVDLLHKRFEPMDIPIENDKILQTTNNLLQFSAILANTASTEYKIDVDIKNELDLNDSLAYERDKSVYEKVHPSLVTVNSIRQIQEGLLLINYPTTVLSRKNRCPWFPRDSILFITQVNELGITGVILNPVNPRVRTQNSVVTVSSRNKVNAIKQFISRTVEGIDTSSHSSFIHQIQGCLSSPMLITSDQQIFPESTPLCRYDMTFSFEYPYFSSYFSGLNSSVSEIQDRLQTGEKLLVKCADPSELLFNQTISRKSMYSNLLHSLGGEWVDIAKTIERTII